MELTIQQQIFDQLGKANRVLIALPKTLQPDNVGSALALAHFLRKIEKEADIVSAGQLPEELGFLPGVAEIKSTLNSTKSLVVVVDTSVKELDEISYQTTDHKISIYLKPKDGSFTPEDVSFSQDKFPYDTIVVLDASSLEDLGEVFEKNADIFFDTPKINIDNHPGNEYFAPINFVDIKATSVAEILSSLLTDHETQLVDEDIATCLLTGIITKTNSFQHSHTTPKAFLKASELIGLGGRQQEVVRHLYKTKSLPLLRLWGRALARLKIEDDLATVYSMLNLSDFGKSGAADSDLHGVLKELLDNISNFKIISLISEVMGGGVRVLAAVHHQIDVKSFADELGGSARVGEAQTGPYKILDAMLAGTGLAEAENRFLAAVRSAHSHATAER